MDIIFSLRFFKSESTSKVVKYFKFSTMELVMFLATGLVSIFGLRLAELAVLKVREGNLYVGQVKNNKNTTNQKRNFP